MNDKREFCFRKKCAYKIPTHIMTSLSVFEKKKKKKKRFNTKDVKEKLFNFHEKSAFASKSLFRRFFK